MILTENALKFEAWTDDSHDFADFNKVYAQFFESGHAPFQIAVQTKLINNMKVDVVCIACKK